MKQRAILLLCILFAACGPNPKRGACEPSLIPDGVEVLTFHAKRRCPTCIAIERLTHEVLRSDFAAQLAEGSLSMRVVDITREKEVADKYRIAWSSLLLCRHKNGAESVTDLTQFAFANARTNPDVFRSELKARIAALLEE